MNKYRVISYDFWNDQIMNEMGFFTTYDDAEKEAQRVALKFSKGQPLETFGFNQRSKGIKSIEGDKGALIQVSGFFIF